MTSTHGRLRESDLGRQCPDLANSYTVLPEPELALTKWPLYEMSATTQPSGYLSIYLLTIRLVHAEFADFGTIGVSIPIPHGNT